MLPVALASFKIEKALAGNISDVEYPKNTPRFDDAGCFFAKMHILLANALF